MTHLTTSTLELAPTATAGATKPPRQAPDVTACLAIHQAMRISNQMLVDAFAGASRFDPARVEALQRWFEGYAAELRTHHRIEDDVIFPA